MKPGSMTDAEKIMLSEANAHIRDQAIQNVARGVFGLSSYITGSLAFGAARFDAYARAVGGSNKANMHHCFPVYKSGDRKTGPLKKSIEESTF